MEFFITAVDAMQKYGLSEQQMWDILKEKNPAIYDKDGKQLDVFSINSLIKVELSLLLQDLLTSEVNFIGE